MLTRRDGGGRGVGREGGGGGWSLNDFKFDILLLVLGAGQQKG